jgi:hypothetical protein
MAKTLKNKDETITIRVKRDVKERAKVLHDKVGTTATMASFLGDMVSLGLQVEEIIYKQHGSAIQAVAGILAAEVKEEPKKQAKGKKAV